MAGKSKRRLIAGKPVIDATSDLMVSVTNRDVKGSRKKSAGGCAAAVALCRLKDVTDARVYLRRTYVLGRASGHWLRYQTPDALRSEIICFDRTGYFAPDDYCLKAPGPSTRLDYRPVRNPPTGQKNTGRGPKPQHFVVGVRPAAPRGFAHGK